VIHATYGEHFGNGRNIQVIGFAVILINVVHSKKNDGAAALVAVNGNVRDGFAYNIRRGRTNSVSPAIGNNVRPSAAGIVKGLSVLRGPES
jgi:hypothetical protein